MDPSPRPTVAWIGAGIMGGPMAGHLLAAGHPVVVHSRRRVSAEPLLAAGATWADTPALAAALEGIVATMVGYPADVREVVLGPDGVLAGARAGTVLVDCTTSEPTLARELHAAGADRDVAVLDCPVSGGDVGARNATLVLMCGGDPDAVARVTPVLELLGTVRPTGGPGTGQHTKMTNQIAIASSMVSLCEALVYAAGAGLDLEATVATIGGGAAGSWALTNLAPRAVRGDLAPGFKVDHLVKDLGIALEEARRMRLTLPGLALAEQLYHAVQAQGDGQEGTQALVAALARISGREWPRA